MPSEESFSDLFFNKATRGYQKRKLICFEPQKSKH